MGQKVSPIGFRLGYNREHESIWYSDDKFADNLKEDELVRGYLAKRIGQAGLSRVYIERTASKVTVTICASRPGIVIGRKGSEVEKLKAELQRITGKDVHINVREVKKPEIDAQLVGDNIAAQIERRISYKRAAKKAIQTAMRLGADGIKIRIAGRLNGSDIARGETYGEGRVPLHTLRADVDFAYSRASTQYGVIGIKTWICKGEKFSLKSNNS
ncbi:30S ribosomal protein S3 [Chitinivibrio alkaliphilus]|uniref:Small ribosomal subunit protein uS3 n=1 Tax=Chitinivibrio alkaliphilus ACht1 TaxID=1313304 RepID=U7DA35_9BACT|nr:30S ribosomal protein S3 [Chitinivibrio alkaliphilus]ERP31295.1 30S ribosomal protein S3 [Chitinivibrio alkaliphilus ACht1]